MNVDQLLKNQFNFYINGEWVNPEREQLIAVINPATEKPFMHISAGNANDVEQAVKAARNAFSIFSQWTVEQRLELLQSLYEAYQRRYDDIALAISTEMGAPIDLAAGYQAQLGLNHIGSAIKSLQNFNFEYEQDGMILRHEPIGVCGMITPWNWPVNQIAVKVAPALAAGCTMILKASEESPLSAIIFAELIDELNLPAGVFNMVHGYGQVVGEAMSTHVDIDMMSFTGSTRGGVAVAKSSADTVKRVCQELGGKSANIILDDCDVPKAVADGIEYCFNNSGQSCNAPTRMLVPKQQLDVAIEAAKTAAENISVDMPKNHGEHIGPVVNRSQFEKIQGLIQKGIDEGATLVAGGVGRPEGLSEGYYVKPTVFANVDNNMSIAREEIFGPVITLIAYEDEADAITIANDTEYGLAGYVSSGDKQHALDVAKHIRAGQVAINYVGGTTDSPFGGYKRSGNGREKGRWGLNEYLELKAITGV